MSERELDIQIKNIPIDRLPTIEKLSNKIEAILKNIFSDAYDRFVLKQDPSRFIILPLKHYSYLPPIIISINPHPNDKNKALFVSLTRKIPLDSSIDILEMLSTVDEILGYSIETIRIRKNGISEPPHDDGNKIYYLVFSQKMHALSMEDEAWFLLVLTALIKIEDDLLGDDEPENDFEDQSLKDSKPTSLTAEFT